MRCQVQLNCKPTSELLSNFYKKTSSFLQDFFKISDYFKISSRLPKDFFKATSTGIKRLLYTITKQKSKWRCSNSCQYLLSKVLIRRGEKVPPLFEGVDFIVLLRHNRWRVWFRMISTLSLIFFLSRAETKFGWWDCIQLIRYFKMMGFQNQTEAHRALNLTVTNKVHFREYE